MRIIRHGRGSPATELCRSLKHRATSRLYPIAGWPSDPDGRDGRRQWQRLWRFWLGRRRRGNRPTWAAFLRFKRRWPMPPSITVHSACRKRSQGATRGTVCSNPARTGLWEPRAGNHRGHAACTLHCCPPPGVLFLVRPLSIMRFFPNAPVSQVFATAKSA